MLVVLHRGVATNPASTYRLRLCCISTTLWWEGLALVALIPHFNWSTAEDGRVGSQSTSQRAHPHILRLLGCNAYNHILLIHKRISNKYHTLTKCVYLFVHCLACPHDHLICGEGVATNFGSWACWIELMSSVFIFGFISPLGHS